MPDDDLRLTGHFDDPTKSHSSGKAPSSWLRSLTQFFLLLFTGSFFISFWSQYGFHFEKGGDARWWWAPMRLEYQMYVDAGYNLNWLESAIMHQFRSIAGSFAPFAELLMLRVYGIMLFIPPAFLFIAAGVSLGSVKYYQKTFRFEHVSSTINNISTKFFLWAIPTVLLFCIAPFGITIPFINLNLPLFMDTPFGAIWLSNPALWAVLLGGFYAWVGYLLGANFSREI